MDIAELLAASSRLAGRADELGRVQAQLRAQAESMRWTSPAATAFDRSLELSLAGVHAARTHLAQLSDSLGTHAEAARHRAKMLNEAAEAARHPGRIVSTVVRLL